MNSNKDSLHGWKPQQIRQEYGSSRDIWSNDNPAPKRSFNPDEVGDEQAYINKKLPDMRIDRSTGRVVRRNAKIQTSFPTMSDEEWARIMSK